MTVHCANCIDSYVHMHRYVLYSWDARGIYDVIMELTEVYIVHVHHTIYMSYIAI